MRHLHLSLTNTNFLIFEIIMHKKVVRIGYLTGGIDEPFEKKHCSSFFVDYIPSRPNIDQEHKNGLKELYLRFRYFKFSFNQINNGMNLYYDYHEEKALVLNIFALLCNSVKKILLCVICHYFKFDFGYTLSSFES